MEPKLYNKNRNDQFDCEDVCMTITAMFGTGGGNTPIIMQEVTGTLSPGAHPGSYNGQDAYNGMLVTGYESVIHRKRANQSDDVGNNSRCAELYERSAESFGRGVLR